MKRISLDPLVERAREREEEAARALADASRRLARQEQQLDELKRYADEYAPPTGGVLQAGALQNRLAFRERLHDAAGEQQRAVEQGRRSCEHDRQALAQAGRETRVLEKVVERQHGEEARAAARLENRQIDDFAVRAFLARREQDEGGST